MLGRLLNSIVKMDKGYFEQQLDDTAQRLSHQQSRKIPDGTARFDHQLEFTKKQARQKMLSPLIGLTVLGYVAAGLMGYFWLATAIVFGIGLLGFVLGFKKLRKLEIEQTETSNEIRLSKKGINTKWGRVGADKKK